MTISQTGLAQLPIRATDGHVFPLLRVASIEAVVGRRSPARTWNRWWP
jgi:hypothetical protein